MILDGSPLNASGLLLAGLYLLAGWLFLKPRLPPRVSLPAWLPDASTGLIGHVPKGAAYLPGTDARSVCVRVPTVGGAGGALGSRGAGYGKPTKGGTLLPPSSVAGGTLWGEGDDGTLPTGRAGFPARVYLGWIRNNVNSSSVTERAGVHGYGVLK